MHLQTLAVSAFLVRSCLGAGGRAYRLRYRDETPSPTPDTSSSYTARRYSYSPLLNATSAGPTATGTLTSSSVSSSSSSPSNGTCGGPTLNVLSASLDWWYSQTLYYAVSTFSLQYNSKHSLTGWTLLPATTPFDITSALETATCTSTLSYNTFYNTSLYDISCFPAPTPVAAETIIITQTAYRNPNGTTGTGKVPNVVVTPAPAYIPIPDYTSTFYQGTPFVYFSTYEIISKVPTTYGNGSVGCTETTEEYPMSTPFGFAYAGPDVNGSTVVGAGVTGDVAPAFLDVVGVTDAVAGSWVAAPTVAMVVQEVFGAEAALAAAPMFTMPSLLTPTATLPPGIPTGPPPNTQQHISTVGGHTEATAPTLQLPPSVPTQGHPVQVPTTPNAPPPPPKTTPEQNTPPPQPKTTPKQNTPAPQPGRTTAPFVASHGNTEITLDIPVDPTETMVTAMFSGGVVTATRVTGNGGHGIPAAVSPTNALEVLSQAAATFTQKNPTVIAIIHGLGPFSSAPNNQDAPVIVVDGTTFTADSSTEFKFGNSQTLTPGGTAVVDGTTLSLLSDASSIVINGHTQAVSEPSITPAPALTIGTHVYTASNGATYVIDGKTLTPGEQETVTIQGTKYIVSLAPGGTVLKIETEGSNGQVTATTYETLTVGHTATSTERVGAHTRTKSTTGPTNTHGSAPSTQGAATALSLHLTAISITWGSLVLALCL